MISRKEAKHDRSGPRLGRRHSSPERVNTARPDEEHCNLALQQVNAEEELSDSEVDFSFTDSPDVQRLRHEPYDPKEEPATTELQIAPFERPKSSGSLQKVFTFKTRQDREINLRRGKKPIMKHESLPLQSTQAGETVQEASEEPDVDPYDGEPSDLQIEQPSFSAPTHSNFPLTRLIDLTRDSSSVASQSVQPLPTADNPQPVPEAEYEDRLESNNCQAGSETFNTKREEESSAAENKALNLDAQSCSPFNAAHLDTRDNKSGEKHKHVVQRHLPETQDAQVQSKEIPRKTCLVPQRGLLLNVQPSHISKKQTQDCSADEDAACKASPSVLKPHNHPLNALQHRLVPEMQSTDNGGPPFSGPKQGNDAGGPTAEIPLSTLPHTPPVRAPRPGEKVTKACKTGSNWRPGQLRAALPNRGFTKALEGINAHREAFPRSNNNAPSEEDLFYLLMYRQRQRKDVETKVMARQKQLETTNARLSHENQNFQRQLVAAHSSSREESAAKASLQKAALEDLKARFQKLKIYVNGLSNDYSDMRHEANQMKYSQQRLSNEKEELYRDLRDCHSASAASERSMRSIASSVAKICQSVPPLERSLLDAKMALEGESRLLSREQHKNKRLETYLFRVATTQNRYSSAIQDEQRAILDQMKEITRKIDSVEMATTAKPQALQLPGLDECVRMLKVLHDVDRVVPADLTKVADAVSVLSQNLSSHQESSNEVSQQAADAQVRFGNELVAQISTLLESFRATSEAKEQLASLQEDKIRFEERLKASESVMSEIRESRTSAGVREEHLRNTTDNLLDELKALRVRSTAVHKPRPPVDERDMLGTWSAKYISMNRELADKDERAGIREQEIRRGEEDIKKLKERLQEVQTERDSACQALKDIKDSQSAKLGEIGDLQQELERKEGSLEALRLEVQSSHAKICEAAKRTEELSARCKKREWELGEVKSELKGATQERAEANEQVQKLSCSLKDFADAQEKAKKVTQLMEELREERVTGTKLRQEIAPLEEIARQVPALKQGLSAKQRDIMALEARLNEAESATREVETMKIEASKAAEEKSKLGEELLNAQEAANWVTKQKEGFHKATQEVEELGKQLLELQSLADRVPILEKIARDHSDEVFHLQQELANAQTSIEQQKDLQEVNRQYSEEITSLKNEVSSAAKKLKHLQSVKDASHQKNLDTTSEKDKHIATLDQELETAKERLKHVKDLQDASVRKDSEILSLKERLEAAESLLKDVQVLKEETQQKENEISILKTRLAKMEELSQQFSQTLEERPSEDHEFSQRMMPIPQEVIPRDGGASQAGLGMAEVPANTGVDVLRTQETTFVPESQPGADLQYERTTGDAYEVGSESSPLTASDPLLESSYEAGDKSAYFSRGKAVGGSDATFTKVPVNFGSSPGLPVGLQKNPTSSRPSSSSYGEPMLLEEEELRIVSQPRDPAFLERSDELLRPKSRSVTSSPEGLRPKNSEASSRNGDNNSTTKSVKSKSKGGSGISSKNLSPRRLRSESQTRPKKVLPLQERDPSNQNIPASPQRAILREKHLPNSAAKRRIEEDEISLPSSSLDSSKRLKRDLSAMEVKTPSNKQKSSRLDQVARATDNSRLNHPSMPTGRRTESMIGISAPAPGTGQHRNKKSKKNPKADRYTARFGQDST